VKLQPKFKNICPLSIAMYISIFHKAEKTMFREVPTFSVNCTEKFVSFYGEKKIENTTQHCNPWCSPGIDTGPLALPPIHKRLALIDK
jgi:hypothetical protein